MESAFIGRNAAPSARALDLDGGFADGREIDGVVGGSGNRSQGPLEHSPPPPPPPPPQKQQQQPVGARQSVWRGWVAHRVWRRMRPPLLQLQKLLRPLLLALMPLNTSGRRRAVRPVLLALFLSASLLIFLLLLLSSGPLQPPSSSRRAVGLQATSVSGGSQQATFMATLEDLLPWWGSRSSRAAAGAALTCSAEWHAMVRQHYLELLPSPVAAAAAHTEAEALPLINRGDRARGKGEDGASMTVGWRGVEGGAPHNLHIAMQAAHSLCRGHSVGASLSLASAAAGGNGSDCRSSDSSSNSSSSSSSSNVGGGSSLSLEDVAQGCETSTAGASVQWYRLQDYLYVAHVPEQLTKAKQHLAEYMALAQHFNRTLILPRVGSSHIGAEQSMPFCAYFDAAALSTEVRWVSEDFFLHHVVGVGGSDALADGLESSSGQLVAGTGDGERGGEEHWRQQNAQSHELPPWSYRAAYVCLVNPSEVLSCGSALSASSPAFVTVLAVSQTRLDSTTCHALPAGHRSHAYYTARARAARARQQQQRQQKQSKGGSGGPFLSVDLVSEAEAEERKEREEEARLRKTMMELRGTPVVVLGQSTFFFALPESARAQATTAIRYAPHLQGKAAAFIATRLGAVSRAGSNDSADPADPGRATAAEAGGQGREVRYVALHLRLEFALLQVLKRAPLGPRSEAALMRCARAAVAAAQYRMRSRNASAVFLASDVEWPQAARSDQGQGEGECGAAGGASCDGGERRMVEDQEALVVARTDSLGLSGHQLQVALQQLTRVYRHIWSELSPVTWDKRDAMGRCLLSVSPWHSGGRANDVGRTASDEPELGAVDGGEGRRLVVEAWDRGSQAIVDKLICARAEFFLFGHKLCGGGQSFDMEIYELRKLLRKPLSSTDRFRP